MTVTAYVVMTAVSLCFLLLGLWAVIFRAGLLFFLSLTAFLSFLPILVKDKRLWLLRSIIFITSLVLSALFFRLVVAQVNQNIERLAAKPRQTEYLHEFSTADRCGIYGLNIFMGLAAYPIYPEVSQETLLMVFKSNGGRRVFRSDFALGSDKVKDALRDIIGRLPSHTADVVEFNKPLRWPAREYRLGKTEARYALALNGSTMRVGAKKLGAHWRLAVSITLPVQYPKDSLVTLIADPPLKVEEGLFWVLQNTGWLHPYEAEWRFELTSNHPALQSPFHHVSRKFLR